MQFDKMQNDLSHVWHGTHMKFVKIQQPQLQQRETCWYVASELHPML